MFYALKKAIFKFLKFCGFNVGLRANPIIGLRTIDVKFGDRIQYCVELINFKNSTKYFKVVKVAFVQDVSTSTSSYILDSQRERGLKNARGITTLEELDEVIYFGDHGQKQQCEESKRAIKI